MLERSGDCIHAIKLKGVHSGNEAVRRILPVKYDSSHQMKTGCHEGWTVFP